MNDILRSLILGIVQGLTEFLPISSSGHLELINYWMGSTESLDSDLLMIILVHFGTACSILYVFRKDILSIILNLLRPHTESGRLGWMIALSMVPAAIIGIFFESFLESIFSGTIIYVGVFLVVTGFVLFFTPKIQRKEGQLNYKNALIIGIAQAIAVLPGISRSGMTIAAGLHLDIDKEKAARFSFLMVLPLIFGKVILDMISGDMVISQTNYIPILTAFVSSFIVGIAACKWMIDIVKRSKIHYFAFYCIAIGLFTIVIALYV